MLSMYACLQFDKKTKVNIIMQEVRLYRLGNDWARSSLDDSRQGYVTEPNFNKPNTQERSEYTSLCQTKKE